MTLLRNLAVIGCVLLLASTAAAQTNLAIKYPEGSTYKTKETINSRQSLKLNGQPLDTVSNTTLVSQTKVGQRNAQGELPIESTYLEVKTELTLPGDKKVSYDSATDEGKTDDPNYQIILDNLKGLKGLTYTVVLDKENRVKSVTGLKPEAGVNADDVKVSLQQMIDRYPKEAVQPGAQWVRDMVIPLGQGQIFSLRRTYKYVGPEVRSTVASTRKLEKVTAVSDNLQYSIRPNAGIPGTVTKSDLKMETGDTTLLFDPAKGRTVESRDKMHVTGALTLSIMNLELNGDLDLTLETTSQEVE
jgi:hypothetical protein